MLGQNSIKQAMNADIAISTPMAEALQLWSAMYENQSPWLNKDIKSLNLAAAIAGEVARLVTIEMKAEFSGSPRAEFLKKEFQKVLESLREKVEQGAAKGGLMMKPYVDGESISVDFVQADQFYPVKFDSTGNIQSCIFSDTRTIGKYFYTRLEFHQLEDQGVVIRNQAFRSTSKEALGTPVPLESVEEWADIAPEALIVGVDRPLYGYFKYPLANNIDVASPLGVSCFSRAVDLIQDADKQWSRLLWEFESGERALYADVLAFGKDDYGNPVLPIRRLYRALNGGSNIGDEEMFHEWTPSLREENILRGLDAILKRIEYTCGLAYGTLSDPQQIDKTATEIKTSKQRTFATVTDSQKSLEKALIQLLYAMDVWATIAKLAPKGEYKVVFEFDDSVIVDRELQFQQDLTLVSSGIMSKVEFRMRNFKEPEAVAKQKIAEAAAETEAELKTQEKFMGA